MCEHYNETTVTGDSTYSQTYRSNDSGCKMPLHSEGVSTIKPIHFIAVATAAAAVRRDSLQAAGAAVRVRHLLSSELAWTQQQQLPHIVISPNYDSHLAGGRMINCAQFRFSAY